MILQHSCIEKSEKLHKNEMWKNNDKSVLIKSLLFCIFKDPNCIWVMSTSTLSRQYYPINKCGKPVFLIPQINGIIVILANLNIKNWCHFIFTVHIKLLGKLTDSLFAINWHFISCFRFGSLILYMTKQLNKFLIANSFLNENSWNK